MDEYNHKEKRMLTKLDLNDDCLQPDDAKWNFRQLGELDRFNIMLAILALQCSAQDFSDEKKNQMNEIISRILNAGFLNCMANTEDTYRTFAIFKHKYDI